METKKKKISFNFLPVRKKKEKLEVKMISQKRMDSYFLFGLMVILVIVPLVLYLGISNSIRKDEIATPIAVEQVKTDDVDYRLHAFLESYILAYFSVSEDTTKQLEQAEELAKFYNSEPEVRTQGQSKLPTTLVQSKLMEIKDNIAVYRVTYETGSDTKQRVTVLFGVPYGGKDGQYYVSGLPFFQAVNDLKAREVSKEAVLVLADADNVTDEDRETLTSFINLFFNNYTTSQENLDVISKGVKSVNGEIFKSLDYTYFKIGTDGNIMAYVQATFEIAGTTHSENFTFYIKEKDDGSFFVEKLEHVIPVNYSK